MATSTYSVWLEPPFGSAASSRTQAFISTFAARSGGACPPFAPHVTLVGGFVGTERDALARCAALARDLVASDLSLACYVADASTGERYHQCVYLLMRATPALAAAHELAARAFGVPPGNGGGAPYMPHLSLVYGRLDAERRAEAANEARADDVLASASFVPDALGLWRTDVEDETCATWKRVDRFHLPTS